MSQTAFYERMVMSHQNNDYDRSKLRLEFGGNNGSPHPGNFLGGAKKRRLMPHAMPSPALLQSPDLKLLKLGSPELEKLIMNNNGFIPTPTPGQMPAFGNGGDSTTSLVDQDRLALGFIEALQKLQDSDGGGGAPTTSTTAAPLPTTTWDSASVGSTVSSGGLNLPIYSKTDTKLSQLQPPTTNSMSPQRWGNFDQPRDNNSVGVITPVIQHRTFLDEPSRDSPSPNLQQKQQNTLPVSTIFSQQSNMYTDLTRPLDISVPRTQANKLVNSSDLSNSPRPDMSAWNQGPMSSASSGNVISETNSPMMLDSIKAEDDSQIVPSMGNFPTDPINLVQQEHIKHERKKLRNRLAAQRCRKRKIEREDTLKDQVTDLKDKNSELSELANKLRMQVCELKQQVMQHANEGCKLFVKEDEEDAKSGSSEYQVL
jgi:hypothetical protein